MELEATWRLCLVRIAKTGLGHWLGADDESKGLHSRWGAATPALTDDLDLKHLVFSSHLDFDKAYTGEIPGH